MYYHFLHLGPDLLTAHASTNPPLALKSTVRIYYRQAVKNKCSKVIGLLAYAFVSVSDVNLNLN